MARHPNAIDKINYVIDFVADMCDAPFTVYVETFFPALLELILSYYALDLMQILTSFARPAKALARSRRGPHGAGQRKRGRPKTRSGRWARWLTYDPYDDLGRRLGGLTDLPGREVSGGVIHFWQLFDILQRIAYWYFVLELTTQFFYKWFSGVNKSFYCQRQRNAWLAAHGDDQTRTGLLNPWPTLCPTIDKIRGPISWNIVAGTYAGTNATFGFSAGFRSIGPIPATFCELVVINTLSGAQQRFRWNSGDGDGRVGLGIKIEAFVTYGIGTYGDGDYEVIAPRVFMVGLEQIP